MGTRTAFDPITVFQEWFPVGNGQTFIIGECSGKSSRRSLENRWAKPCKSVLPPRMIESKMYM